MAKPDSATSNTLLASQWAAYQRARDSGHVDYLREMKKSNDFYIGDQWDSETLDKLDREGRPHLTINQILPTINTVLGEQAAYRATAKLKPRRDGDNDTAQLLQKLITGLLDSEDYNSKESEVFADGLIVDRGFFDVRVDYERNINGDLSITVEDPADIVLDPDASEYDPETWNEVYKTRWLSVDQIEADYGKKALDKVKTLATNGFIGDSLDTDMYQFCDGTFGEGQQLRIMVDGEETKWLRSVRVIERQSKQMTQVKYLLNSFGDLRPAPAHWDDDFLSQYAVENNYRVVEKRGFRIRWTVTVGDMLTLHDDWSPYPWFSIVPYFPYFRRGKPFGMVRNLRSPQEQYNKLSSQELHIVNSTANSGWIVEENSLGDGLTLADIEEQGSQTGFVMSYRQGHQAPQKIQPNQIPSGVDRLSMKAQASIRDISGIHAPMQGNASPELSGKALQNQIARGQIQIQKPLDHLAKTRKFVVERVLWIIQNFYTQERIVYYTTPDDDEQAIRINQETASAVKNDVTLGEYAVTITQQPARDNYQATQFSQLLELKQAGVPIPDHLLVKYTDVADRDFLVETLKKMQGFAEPTPQEQQLAEFQQKTQIMSIQLDLARKQKELEKLSAETQKLMAETDGIVNPQAFQNQMKMIELQAEIQQNIDNLTARMEMSKMSNATQLEKAGAANMVQMRGQDLQQEGTILSALSNQAAAATADDKRSNALKDGDSDDA